MNLFSDSKRKATTASPNFSVDQYDGPNVGQYGWTKTDNGRYNQLIQYVDECRKILEEIKDVSSGLPLILKYIEEIRNIHDEILETQKEINDSLVAFEVKYVDFSGKYVDFTTKYNNFLVKSEEILAEGVKFVNEAKSFADKSAQSAKESSDFAQLSKTHSDTSASHAAASEASAVKSEASAVKSEEAYQKSEDIYEELRKGQVYRGVWNPHSGAYPDAKGTNSVWDVNLNSGEVSFDWDSITWYNGDRLVYMKDENKYQQLASGKGSVTSVNGKTGAVTLNSADVGAFPSTGGTLNGAAAINGALRVEAGQGITPGFFVGATNRPIRAAVGVSGTHDNAIFGMSSNKSSFSSFIKIGESFVYQPISSSVEHRIYHEGFKPTAGDVGAAEIVNNTIAIPIYSGTSGATLKTQLGDGVDGKETWITDRPASVSNHKAIGITTAKGPVYWNGTSQKRIYNEDFKPTASDVGALPLTGGALTGDVSSTGFVINGRGKFGTTSSDGAGVQQNSVRLYSNLNLWLDAKDAVYTGGNYGHSLNGWYKPDPSQPSSFLRIHKDPANFALICSSAGSTNPSQYTYRIYHEGYKPTATEVGAVHSIRSFKGNLSTPSVMSSTAIASLDSGVTGNPPGTGGHGDHVINMFWDNNAGGQIYVPYNTNLLSWRRRAGGTYSDWMSIYHTGNKPSAGDVGAIPSVGGKATGAVTVEFTDGAPKLVLSRPGATGNVTMAFDTGSTRVRFGLRSDGKLGYATSDDVSSSTASVIYSSTNKPTAAEIGALPTSGGNMTGTIHNSGRMMATGSGNDYNNGAFEARGNGTANTVFPTYGFHQPGTYAGSLQMKSGSDFYFYKQGGSSLANVKAGTVSSTRFEAGYSSGQDNSVSCSNWFRSNGNTGWYNDAHGGGIHMSDSTWVRVYGNKKFYVSKTDHDAIYTSGGIKADKDIRGGGNLYIAGTIQAGKIEGTVEGVSASAVKLQNPRTLTIGKTGKPFDGSANVSWTLAELGAVSVDSANKIEVPIHSGTVGATIKTQLDTGGASTDKETWMTDKPDSVSAHKGLGITTRLGPLYWNGSAKKRIYNEDFKPTASDVGAIPLTGSTGITGHLRTSGELQSTNSNGLRLVYGNYGAIWRNDGNNFYLLSTASGNQFGDWNSYRPFRFGFATGELELGSGLLINNTSATFSKPVTINTGSGTVPGLKVGSTTHKAAMAPSTTTNEGIFGVAGSGGDFTSYIRVGSTSTSFTVSPNANTQYKLYHEGNKPTYTDVGAAPAGFGIGNIGAQLATISSDVRDSLDKTGGGHIFVDQDQFSAGRLPWYSAATGDRFAHVANFRHSGGPEWSGQIALSYNGNHLAIRARNNNSTLTNWSRVYHQGFKPTASDVGAVSKTGDTMTGTLTAPNLTLSNAAGSTYITGGGDGASGTVANLKLCSWYGVGFSPTIGGQPIPAGENAVYINVRNGDLTARGRITGATVYEGSNRVYSAANKPTASDVGALPITGGTLTGSLQINAADSSGSQGLLGASGKTMIRGTSAGAVVVGNYVNGSVYLDCKAGSFIYARIGQGTEYKVYHEGNKPTAAAVGAMAASSSGPDGGYGASNISSLLIRRNSDGVHVPYNQKDALRNWLGVTPASSGTRKVLWSGNLDGGTLTLPAWESYNALTFIITADDATWVDRVTITKDEWGMMYDLAVSSKITAMAMLNTSLRWTITPVPWGTTTITNLWNNCRIRVVYGVV